MSRKKAWELPELRAHLLHGQAIPAHPLALTAARKLDERRQRALSRYYLASGSGGLAVAVHTTQFAIRDASHGLLEPVLSLAAEELAKASRPVIGIAGVCGTTSQAIHEAQIASNLGYDCGLLSLSAWKAASEDQILMHCREVSSVIPIFGFYLQPAVGGRVLSHRFWREFVEIERVVAIKIAPFNRYQTWDVVRAVLQSGRTDVALYTGNDDNIAADLMTEFPYDGRFLRIVGGLLGHWSTWTQKAIHHFQRCRQLEPSSTDWPQLLQLGVEITDINSAFFDAANGFHGCIAGIHESLRRNRLLEGIWCLDPNEGLGQGQYEEIDRVERMYPHWNDKEFIDEHLDAWLSG